MKSIAAIASLSLIISFGCQVDKQDVHVDPLPSWNDTDNKHKIVQFVESVVDINSANYVEVKDRIAVFDNDGTLWAEKPVYFQLFFAMDRLKSIRADIEISEDSPLNSLLAGDMSGFSSSGNAGIIELIMTTHAGMSTEEFEKLVKQWIDTARHPETNKFFSEMVYQPMMELLNYLQDNEFKTFIVSGGGIEFMRPWVERTYGIPRDQVVGSSIKTKFINDNGQVRIERLPEIDFINDKEGKPLAINRFIGRKPIFCAGNSDGDLPMMQWTASGEGKRMMLYIHHTDSVREWAYDRNSSVGHFDKALDEAGQKNWTVVSMKDDWKLVYP